MRVDRGVDSGSSRGTLTTIIEMEAVPPKMPQANFLIGLSKKNFFRNRSRSKVLKCYKKLHKN